jgi:hypothetical protein
VIVDTLFHSIEIVPASSVLSDSRPRFMTLTSPDLVAVDEDDDVRFSARQLAPRTSSASAA